MASQLTWCVCLSILSFFKFFNLFSFTDIAAGAADDWAYGAGIKYSYTLELRDTGNNGFILPPEQIKPSGAETLAALLKMTELIAEEIGVAL